MENQNEKHEVSKEHVIAEKSKIVKFIELIIFEQRWLLNLFYIGLIVGLLIYAWVFAKTLFHSISSAPKLTYEHAMLMVLELVDMVMVANLVKMIITGSYNSFVSKAHGRQNENISSGMLKIKMSTSLIGVTSIHLLQTYLNEEVAFSSPIFLKQISIHSLFLIGALILAGIEYLHDKGEALHSKGESH